jgi:hypothetical protein
VKYVDAALQKRVNYGWNYKRVNMTTNGGARIETYKKTRRSSSKSWCGAATLLLPTATVSSPQNATAVRGAGPILAEKMHCMTYFEPNTGT